MFKQSKLVFSLFVMLAVVALVGFATVQPVQAAEYIDDGTVSADEVINDDLFLSGQNVSMDGTVNGVLVAAGSQVTINGTVNGDLFAFGERIVLAEGALVTGNFFSGANNIEVLGTVEGSFFAGSGSAELGKTASIGRNLYFGGFSLETLKGSTIGVDLYSGAYQALLNGQIERDVNIGAAAVELAGEIGRNATLDVEGPNVTDYTFIWPNVQPGLPAAVDTGLRISPEAKIGGNLRYTSPVNQSGSIQTQPGGQVIYQTPVPVETDQDETPVIIRTPDQVEFPVLNAIFKMVRNFVTLMILGGLALWLLPNLFLNTVDEARKKALPSAGVGFLSILAGYSGALFATLALVALGLLLWVISLGGLGQAVFGVGFSGIALVMAIFTLLISYGSKLVVAFLIGDLLIRQISPNASNTRFWALLAGVAIYVLLRAIPIVGWLIAAIATLVGLGAMWYAYQSSRQQRTVPAPVEQG